MKQELLYLPWQDGSWKLKILYFSEFRPANPIIIIIIIIISISVVWRTWTLLHPGPTEHIKILPLQFLFLPQIYFLLHVEFFLLISIEEPGDNEQKFHF